MIRERRCFLYCLATAVATAALHSRLWSTPYHREADCAALAQSALVVPGMLASYCRAVLHLLLGRCWQAAASARSSSLRSGSRRDLRVPLNSTSTLRPQLARRREF